MVYFDNGCFYNELDESIEHVRRDCFFTRELVESFPVLNRIFQDIMQLMSFMDWMVGCSENLSKEAFSLLMIVLWFV